MTVIQNQCGIKSSFGMIWMNTGNYTGLSVSFGSNTYLEFTSLGTNFTLSSPNKDFAMTTDGRLKYTGINTKTFTVTGYYGNGDSARHALAIYKNGVLVSESYSDFPQMTYITAPVSMATNDYVSLYGKRLTANSINIYQINLSAVSQL